MVVQVETMELMAVAISVADSRRRVPVASRQWARI
jgi:hypothetical protein